MSEGQSASWLAELSPNLPVRVAAGAERVETVLTEVEEDGVVLEVREGASVGAALGPGTEVQLEWLVSRGLKRMAGTVVGRLPGAVIRFEVRPNGQADVIQRREDVRVAVEVPVVARPKPGEPAEGRTRDLSGGGMLVDLPVDLERGDEVPMTLELPDERPIEVVARVVRSPERDVYACAFVRIGPYDSDKIVRFAFAAQRERQLLARKVYE
jgi:c-di-GMP-binding flagellar brake protein YcgR